MRTRLAGGVVALCVVGLQAQEEPGRPARTPGPIAQSVDAQARELWPSDMQTLIDELTRPRFRSSVEVDVFALPPPWLDEVPPRLRSSARGGYHREMLTVMTPQEFRSGTVVSVGVDPGSVWHGVRDVWRDWQDSRIRKRIQQEADALRANAPPPD